MYKERKAREKAEAAPKAVVAVGEVKKTVTDIRSLYREDFEGFCSHVEVFTEDVSGEGGTVRKIVPFLSTQERFLRERTRRDLILKARQQGFTTLEVSRDCWFFLTRPGSRTVIVVQSQKDDGPLKNVARMVQQAFEGLAHDGFDVEFSRYTENLYQLPDGAVLEILTAGVTADTASKVAASYSIQRLHVTEVAKFEQADLTMLSLTSCVSDAPGTEVVIESTAQGAQGYFYDKWQDTQRGVGSYKGHFFPWWARSDRREALPPGEVLRPRDEREKKWLAEGVTPEQVAWYRRKQADVRHQDLVDQDFPSDDATCFRLSGSGFFSPKALATMKLLCRAPARSMEVRSNEARGEIRFYHDPVPGKEYELSADPSGGLGGDPCAGHVYERGTGRLMAVIDGQIQPWEFGKWLASLGKRYNWARIGVERNNHGHATIGSLTKTWKYPNVFVDEDGHAGWNNTTPRRALCLDKLEQVVRMLSYSMPDSGALQDFFSFVTNKNGKAEATPGKHDDHVLAAAIGWDLLTRTWQKVDLTNLPAF